MRKTTRKKYYGRSAIAGSLQSAINSLNTAIKEAGEPQRSPLSDALRQVSSELNTAAKAFEVYGVNKKRLQNELRKELKNLQALLEQVRGMPVLPDEKVIAKHARSTKGKVM